MVQRKSSENTGRWNVGPTRRIILAPSRLTSTAEVRSRFASLPPALRLADNGGGKDLREERARRTGEAPWRCEQLRRRRQASFLLPPPSPRGASRSLRRRRRSPPGAASVCIVFAPSRVRCYDHPSVSFFSFLCCFDFAMNRYYRPTPFSGDPLQVPSCLWRSSTHPLIYS